MAMTHIFVSSLTGSNELAGYIVPQSRVRLSAKLPVDVLFTGNGEGGDAIEFAIEHKRLPDVLDCINTGRFAGNQLEPLRDYEYRLLIVEGLFKRGRDESGGRLEVHYTPLGRSPGWYSTSECGWGQRDWHFNELQLWLLTQWFCGGVPYVVCANKYESGRFIGDLWRWWNDKAFEEHRSHLAKSTAHIAPLRGDLPLIVRACAEIGGIGTEGVRAAERTFGSLYEAVTGKATGSEKQRDRKMSEERWATMLVGGGVGKRGKRKRASRLGAGTAKKIVDEIRGAKLGGS